MFFFVVFVGGRLFLVVFVVVFWSGRFSFLGCFRGVCFGCSSHVFGFVFGLFSWRLFWLLVRRVFWVFFPEACFSLSFSWVVVFVFFACFWSSSWSFFGRFRGSFFVSGLFFVVFVLVVGSSHFWFFSCLQVRSVFFFVVFVVVAGFFLVVFAAFALVASSRFRVFLVVFCRCLLVVFVFFALFFGRFRVCWFFGSLFGSLSWSFFFVVVCVWSFSRLFLVVSGFLLAVFVVGRFWSFRVFRCFRGWSFLVVFVFFVRFSSFSWSSQMFFVRFCCFFFFFFFFRVQMFSLVRHVFKSAAISIVSSTRLVAKVPT